jgi:hypothetical protein
MKLQTYANTCPIQRGLAAVGVGCAPFAMVRKHSAQDADSVPSR